jgi:hypothetical protein
MFKEKLFLGFLYLSMPLLAQTYNTSCTLYPNAAYCTTTRANGGSASTAEAQRQQYETGQAVGSGVGMAIFRAHFPGWRRKHCSQHPEQPFDYRNARGDSITGTCPTLNQLANEAAQEFRGKHPYAVKSPEQAQAMDKYIADNKLSPWEPKSYEKAAEATDKMATAAPAPATDKTKDETASQGAAAATQPKAAIALTNSDVVGMAKAGIGPDIIVAKIKSTPCSFDTSPAALKELKDSGLADNVILAMVEASKD